MAGVVAMASVVEDFDTQPCKKSRKDGGSPVVKTITNYFSPVAKPVEKPFSPPRSNNIKDYFSRVPLSSKEKNSPSEQSKENCQTSQSKEKCTSPEAAVKQPSQKRSRKAIKATRKLVESETVSSTALASCLTVDEPHQITDSAAEVTSVCGVLVSETASLLAWPSAEACITAEVPESSATIAVDVAQAEEEQHDGGSRCGHSVELKKKKSINSSPDLPSSDQAEQVNTDGLHFKRRHQQQAMKPRLEEMEAETSMCDLSTEVNVDQALQSSNSTIVTISFEDFVRSQGNGKDERAKEEEVDLLKNVVSAEPVLQVSPRTVTIQAEVHAVSPQQEAAMDVAKFASIFNKRKEASSPELETGQELPSTLLTVKRKSNVVLQEEDLELAIIESESTAKCSETERKQFMAAFKRPSVEASKTKPGKSQSKQKQPGEKNVDAAYKADEEEGVITPSVEQVPAASPEKNEAGKKRAKRVRKKATGSLAAAAAAPPPPPAEDALAVSVDVDADDKKEEPAIPALRRSRREAAVRQSPDTTTETSLQRSTNQNESQDAAAATSPGCPTIMPTPKARKSKHGSFVAQMVCPPDRNESPIRIKFTRVHRNVSKGDSGSSIKTKATKTPDNESKKRKQAKKLVKKAKVIQHSRKSVVEGKDALRRSSRKETSKIKSYCENEDSVICLGESSVTPPTAPVKTKTQKPLRSLNEVLGKASSVKETKALSGSRVALLGQEKAARKASVVISIFDDSSREGSDNSQDDEQFKARRDFLKSGLPDSFRKQIAKTTATKEAYSLSCSSFQPVVHIKQPPNDCSLWALPWPESSLLCQLKERYSRTPPTSSVGGSCCLKTEPARRAFCERGSGWRPEIPESVLELLIEEVNTSNPSFPIQRFISRFLKRRADHQQHCMASETATSGGGKRKRTDEEGENTAKVAKKQRGYKSEGSVSIPEPTKKGGRSRRAQRSKPAKEEGRSSPVTAPIPTKDDSVVELDDLVLVEDTVEKDVVKEDVLWTEKYQPQHSTDIIGNTASVRRLHSWLKEWKLRADREERKKQKDKKREEGSQDSDWDCGEEDSQDAEDMLCNTVLITGPTGVGKTAAVYACAQELGFKVFEVNASSQRSGRLILSQLREATQSHQVDSQGVNAHKPTYFNSYSTSSSTGTFRPGSSPRKVNSPRRVVSSPRKHPQSPRGAKKGSLAPTALAKFFKTGQTINNEPQNTKKNEQKADSKNVVKGNNEGANKRKDLEVKLPAATTPNDHPEEQNKKTATSLILFEEVDVIFDEDSGFLAAIKTFMTTTKRPVILTTSDPSFSTLFDGNFEEIHFKSPSLLNVGTYLRLLCLAEDVRTDPANIRSLLKLNGCDIRQSLLQLQFWTRSAGGRHVGRPLTPLDNNDDLKPESGAQAAVTLPPCESGCAESRLGLLNVQPDGDIWELFRGQSLEEAVCQELLMDSRRRGVDLLYSNMETLLPLPLTQLTRALLKPNQSPSDSQDQHSVEPKVEPPSDTLPSRAPLLHVAESADCLDDGSPVKVSNRMKKNKKRHCLPESVQSDSDSEESFLSLCKPHNAPQAKEAVEERLVSQTRKRKPLAPGERLKSVPVSQCLESMADFLDNMSYVDSSLPFHPAGSAISRRTSPAGAVVKDGMTDELRVESDRGSWVRAERGLEIQATVEAMSFHKCRVSVAEAWHKAQQLEGELREEAARELTLPVAPHCVDYSFSQDGPCQPQLVQRRGEVLETLTLRGLVGTLGNRTAAALDYLPALRTICRSEQLKERGKVKRRFLHYLDAIHLGLDKNTLRHLAEDFP